MSARPLLWGALSALTLAALLIWGAIFMRAHERAEYQSAQSLDQWINSVAGNKITNLQPDAWTAQIADAANSKLISAAPQLVRIDDGEVREISVTSRGPLLRLEIVPPWITDVVVKAQLRESELSKASILKIGSSVNLVGRITDASVNLMAIPPLPGGPQTNIAVLTISLSDAQFQ